MQHRMIADRDAEALGYPVVTISAQAEYSFARGLQRRTRLERRDASGASQGDDHEHDALLFTANDATRTILAGTVWRSASRSAAAASSEALPKSVVQSFEQAFNADDLDGCLALFDDDAQILPERGPAVSGSRWHRRISARIR